MLRALAILLTLASPALAGTVATGVPAHQAAGTRMVAPQLPAQRAFVASPHAPACGADARLMSRAAYTPGLRRTSETAVQCGRLLSTDTVMMAHQWDRT